MGRSQINYLFTYKHDLKYWGLLPVNPQVPGSSPGRGANNGAGFGVFAKTRFCFCMNPVWRRAYLQRIHD